MGKKINPFIFRVNINRNWNSFWYTKKNNYSNYLIEDINIRNYLNKFFKNIPSGKIIIFKNLNFVFINIYLKKISFNRYTLKNLKKNLLIFTDKKIFLKFKNILKPNLDVKLIFFYIKKKIELNSPFKGVLRNIINEAFKSKCFGLKISIQGRINGNILTRKQVFCYGKLPLQRFCSNIKYYSGAAKTSYGVIGVKIWIYLGDYVY